jgi:hypothetical protein
MIAFRIEAKRLTGGVVDLEKRDQRHLQRHDQKADDGGDQERTAGKLHPAERIGGEGRDQDRDDRRGDGHGHRIEE